MINGDHIIDRCNNCSSPADACVSDCHGVWGGLGTIDVCDVCGGDGICRDAVHVDITLPGGNSICEIAAAIKTAVSTAASLDEQYISILACNIDANTEHTTLTFEFLVESSERRRMQYASLMTDLGAGVAAASGVSTSDVATGLPTVVPIDCAGVAGGSARLDACNICAGNNGTCSDCAGVPNGEHVRDQCGNCDATTSNDCTKDCHGVWGGTDSIDGCAVCGGDNSSCADCLGIPHDASTYTNWRLGLLDHVVAERDNCDNCDSNTSTDCTLDCLGVWGGNATFDACRVCDGDSSSCAVDPLLAAATPNAIVTLQTVGNPSLYALQAAVVQVITGPSDSVTVADADNDSQRVTVRLIAAKLLLSGVELTTALTLLNEAMAGEQILGLAPGQSVFLSLAMKCPAGFIPSADGACTHCPRGEEPNAQQTGCLKCALRVAGHLQTWFSPDGAECKLCPAGTTPDVKRTFCTVCQEDNAANEGDGQQCKACSAGKEPDANHSSCVLCPENYFSVAGTCEKCELGRYSAGVGGLACNECELGRTGSAAGSGCELCDEGYYSLRLGGACKACADITQPLLGFPTKVKPNIEKACPGGVPGLTAGIW